MIIARNLCKTFTDSIKAADDLSFHISKGETVGLIGANGAGKTTLIRLISGVLSPDSGFLRVMNENPLGGNKSLGLNMGIVFGIGGVYSGKGKASFGFDVSSALGNSGNLEPDITVGHNFELIRAIYRISKNDYNKRLEELSASLDIKSFLNFRVNQLSLGQRMRVELAAILLYEPELIILDEPFIGIDVVTKETIRKKLKQLADDKAATIILSTHNVEEIERICDRVIFLDKGKMIYNGGFERIKYTYGKIHSLTVEIEGKFPDLQDLPIEKYCVYDNKLTIWYDAALISSRSITKFLISQCKILDLLINKPTIEEIIKQIYREGENGQSDN